MLGSATGLAAPHLLVCLAPRCENYAGSAPDAVRHVLCAMCRATVPALVHEAEKTKAVASIPWQTGGDAGGGRTAESVIPSARDDSRATASHLCVESMICLPNIFSFVVASEQERPITSVTRGR